MYSYSTARLRTFNCSQSVVVDERKQRPCAQSIYIIALHSEYKEQSRPAADGNRSLGQHAFRLLAALLIGDALNQISDFRSAAPGCASFPGSGGGDGDGDGGVNE